MEAGEESGVKEKGGKQVKVLVVSDQNIVSELLRLERRIFPKHESLATSFDREVQRRNTAVLYALQDEADVVAGFIMYSWTSLAATISKLAVKEICRRQGFGEALLMAALLKIQSRKVFCVNLHVDPARTAALALYRKFGFKMDTLVKSYYSADRDAYRMVLTLQES